MPILLGFVKRCLGMETGARQAWEIRSGGIEILQKHLISIA